MSALDDSFRRASEARVPLAAGPAPRAPSLLDAARVSLTRVFGRPASPSPETPSSTPPALQGAPSALDWARELEKALGVQPQDLAPAYLERAVEARDFGWVLRLLEKPAIAARRLPGTDPFFRWAHLVGAPGVPQSLLTAIASRARLDPKCLSEADRAPAALRRYLQRRVYWENVAVLRDGQTMPERNPRGIVQRPVDFALRLERLAKLAQSGSALVGWMV